MSAYGISTKYLPVTNTRGSRIKATHGAPHLRRSVTVGYDHALDSEGNHRAALDALLARFPFIEGRDCGEWHGGWMDGGERVWVFVRPGC